MSGCFHLSCRWPVVVFFEFEAEAESHFMNDEVRRFLQVGKLTVAWNTSSIHQLFASNKGKQQD